MRRTISADTGRRSDRFTNNNVKSSQSRSSRPHSVTVGPANLNNKSDVLQLWMSRSVSAPSLPNRQLLSINGRANKASTLRLQCRPSLYVQPNYREMIRKRKGFAQRSKSLSASAVKCSELPNGESLHAFVTGARYNRAHHLDSRSLECFGLYIPRGNASRSFINESESLSCSTIHGMNVKATRNMSDSHFMQPTAKQETGMLDLKSVPQCQSDSESESMTSLDREVNVVFGPSHSSSSSDSEVEMSPFPSKEVPEHENGEHNIEPSKENQESLMTVAPIKEPVDECSDVKDTVNVANSTHLEVKQLKDGDKVDLKLGIDGKHVQVNKSRGDLDAKQVQESEHDFISLEALKLTADILQQSSSSIASSVTAKTNTTVEEEIDIASESNRKTRPDTHASKLPVHHSHSSFEVQSTLVDVADETDTCAAGGSQENVANDLTSKSSTIFVDMSNLMAQEKLSADHDCNTGIAEDVVETQVD